VEGSGEEWFATSCRPALLESGAKALRHLRRFVVEEEKADMKIRIVPSGEGGFEWHCPSPPCAPHARYIEQIGHGGLAAFDHQVDPLG
jgi:hypothetical protein